ncbi:MAG: Wadjet anti-phage system protein JetA family protein [Oscillospiraceae bacterium]
MNLYDVIPENLFSVLASKNKSLYVKTLFVLLEAFKSHLKISKDELVSMISARLDDDIISTDFSEEELLESEYSVSGKAHFLVRRLKSAGWILIETENDFKEYVTVPGFSYKIIRLLYEIANISESENFAYVYSTYSSLKNADETRDPYEMITALCDGAERTEKLVESLKSVYHSITYYNQQLISTLNVNNVLHSHYERYQEEIVSRILRWTGLLSVGYAIILNQAVNICSAIISSLAYGIRNIPSWIISLLLLSALTGSGDGQSPCGHSALKYMVIQRSLNGK